MKTSPPRPTESLAGPLGLVLGLALLVRLVGLGSESFWFDEIWAVKQARLPLGDLLVDLRDYDVHPPLWPLLLHCWISLVGEAEWLVRIPSVLAGTAAVAFVVLFIDRAGDRVWALRSGLLLALAPYAVDFSQEARAYALLLALSAASLWALVSWVKAPGSRRHGALWALLAAALLYTHVFGALVVLAQGLYVLVHVPALRRSIVLAGGTSILLYLPWIPSQLAQIGRVQENFWIEPLRWSDPVFWVWHWAGYRAWLAVLLVGLAALGVPGAPPATRRLFAWLVACVLVLPALASLFGQPIFQAKYAITMIIPLFVLAARGLERLPRPWFGTGVLAILLGSVVVTGTWLHRAKEQYRELGVIADAAASRGAVLVTEPGMLPYVDYYTENVVLTELARPREHEGPVLVLLAHPAGASALEALLGGRCRQKEETVLVGARAVEFECPRTPR